jgi:hypothetical protein
MASELQYHRETFVDQIVQLMEKSILSGEIAPKIGLSEAIGGSKVRGEPGTCP